MKLGNNLCKHQSVIKVTRWNLKVISLRVDLLHYRTSAKAKQVLEQKLKYLREKLQKFRHNRLALQNKDKEFHGYTVGQIVYMYHPRGSLLQTASKKIKCEFVGPLAIYKCVSLNQFLLMSLDGYLYPFLVEETRIKPGFIPTSRGNVSHLAELKKIIRSRFQLQGI